LLQNPSDKILSALGFAADTVLLTPLLAQKNNNLPALPTIKMHNVFLEDF